MSLTITARHFRLSPSTKARAIKRTEKLSRYAPAITGMHLVVTREKSRFEAELVLTARGLKLVGKGEAMDSPSAVDMAIDRLTLQLKRKSARRKGRHVRQAHAWAEIRKSG